jgi:hypothetical protein
MYTKKTIKMRKVLSVLSILSVLLVASCNDKSGSRYVRKNANSSESQADVEAMNKAMEIMKSKDCNDPTSWYYQAAIHWIPLQIDSNKLCESYTDWTELKMAWDECTHSNSGAEEINFLIWHRMYIWHFEKIVRKTSGKKDFALPYWGYTNYNNPDKIMPTEWRDTSSSLYEEARVKSLNNGKPIEGSARRAIDGDYPKLMQITDYQTFNSNFDRGIHGTMHNYIGMGNHIHDIYYNRIMQKNSLTGLMAQVPTAGFDPIFWAHHSNIDRVFQKWLNSPYGQKITLQQLKDNPWKYQFFDENGKSVVYTPEEVMAVVYNMDYDYDDTKVYLNTNAPDAKIGPREILASSTPNTLIKGESTHVGTLTSPANYNNSKTLLEISTTFDELPMGVYEVYINHTDGTQFDPKDVSFIGIMSFFGANHGDPRNKKCLNGCCSPVSEDGKPMTVFKYELNTSAKYDIIIYKQGGEMVKGLKVNKLAIRNYALN